jgi:hypothetical protein
MEGQASPPQQCRGHLHGFRNRRGHGTTKAVIVDPCNCWAHRFEWGSLSEWIRIESSDGSLVGSINFCLSDCGGIAAWPKKVKTHRIGFPLRFVILGEPTIND